MHRRQIASGAFDTVGDHVQGLDLVRRTQADDGERRLDLLSQTVCLIFGFLFCAFFVVKLRPAGSCWMSFQIKYECN